MLLALLLAVLVPLVALADKIPPGAGAIVIGPGLAAIQAQEVKAVHPPNQATANVVFAFFLPLATIFMVYRLWRKDVRRLLAAADVASGYQRARTLRWKQLFKRTKSKVLK